LIVRRSGTKFPEGPFQNVPRECFTEVLISHSAICIIFHSSLPAAKNCAFLPTSLCLSSLRAEQFPDSQLTPGFIAPKLCNLHHRVEFCGVNPSTSSSFHKVINIHVQNFTALKQFSLHFGILRASTPPVSLLTRPIPDVRFLTSAQDDRLQWSANKKELSF
jgi:hypothetical protein